METNDVKRALVCSGGGAKGAFAGGIIQYLVEEEKQDYDIFVGTSAGALLLPFTALKKMDELKTAFTTVGQNDIFDINPFKIVSNNNGQVKAKINKWNVARNLLPKLITKRKFPFVALQKGNVSFGRSYKLRKLIKKFISEEDYQTLLDSNKEVIVSVLNLTEKELEFKSCNDFLYNDFIDWMWACASAYPFMSIVEKNNKQYVDGGVVRLTPIQVALDKGATEIDVIILKEEVPSSNAEIIRNPFHGVTVIVNLMTQHLNSANLRLSKLKTDEKHVKLRLFYLPRPLTNNALVFNRGMMFKWWEEGYHYAKYGEYQEYSINKTIKRKS